MDKIQAQNIVRSTFESPFDKSKFAGFVKNLLNRIEEKTFSYRGSAIPDPFQQHVSLLERVGKYSDGEHHIDIFAVKLRKETSIERARSMQRNLIAWYLNGSRGGEMKDAALAAFVSPNEDDWRFSLVKMDYRFEEGKNGRLKVKEEFTPARRWSFLVGRNENSHTAQSRLVPIIADDEQDPTLAQLEDAFNVERITKEFFEEYRKLFLWTKETLDEIVSKYRRIKDDFEAKGVNTVDFAKKLLGQIVFLYFLQKKGWFGVKRDDDWGTGPRNFLRELFEGKHCIYTNFFNDVMEPLLYQALRSDRRHDDDFYDKLNCKIPFLNGGLFDPINNYDWVHTDILLPNELFSNTKRTKEGDTGNGILDVFDRYNFTVKEDEPLEKEVAVDPEMLGKVFENLLEAKDRKSKGTYYTPREIVHYMCQQSLINYLYTELNPETTTYEKTGNKAKDGQLDMTIEHRSNPGIPKEDIEDFIQHGESVLENEAAAGSAKSYSYKLEESIHQNAKLIDEKLANIKICDPAIGSGAFPVGMMTEIVKARNVLSTYIKDSSGSIYDFKRECIEKSLYGVDIDPGAVEIAKLRLWLSLIVDEEDIKQIKPLPNLDYKIVCGNSLLGVERNLFNNERFRELERLKPLFFNETSPGKKQEYKERIDDLISQITNGHKEFGFEVYFSEVFHEKKGFDVVIANPPYVFTRKMGFSEDFKKHVRKYYFSEFESVSTGKAKQSGKINLFSLFVMKAIQISNQEGLVTYILPNTILRTTTYDIVRKCILDKTKLIRIVDLGGGIFDAVTASTIILIVQKDTLENINDNEMLAILKIEDPELRKFSTNKIKQSRFYSNISYVFNILVDSAVSKILERISHSNKELGDLCIDIIEGIVAHKHLITELDVKNSHPLLEGKNIKKYYIVPHTKGILWKPQEIHRTRPAYLWQVDRKILIQRISGGHNPLVAALDTKRSKTFASINNLILKNEYEGYYSYILGLLNSRLMNFYYASNFSNKSELTVNISKTFLEKLPIKLSDEEHISKIKYSVESILAITKDEDYLQDSIKQAKVKTLEQEIDQLIYKLYGLTEEEIRIVEGADS